MRESTINTRGMGMKNSQRAPARRERSTKPQKGKTHFDVRRLARWLPLASKTLFAVMLVLVLIAGYRAVAGWSFFRAERVDVTGVTRASADHLAALVRGRAAKRNVWQLDLNALSGELEREPWVRQAIVSRVLPSGLRVRITEREPAVVVRTGEGRLMWADTDAVLLARVQPTDDLPPFFLRGYDETLTASAQTENRRRIKAAVKMTDEWRRAGVANRVSEVDVDDLRDVRAQLAGKDADVEIRLMGDDHANRLLKALEKLDANRDALAERRARRGERLTRIETATLPRHVIFGFDRGASLDSEQMNRVDPTGARSVDNVAPVVRATTSAGREAMPARLATPPARPRANAARANDDRLGREVARRTADARQTLAPRVPASATAAAQRPRRIG